jgi:5-formyltetrahydrofolate cyclo-ligase
MRAGIKRAMLAVPPAAMREAAVDLREQLWGDEGALATIAGQGRVLLGYVSLPDEVDPAPAMQQWLDQGGRLAVPVCDWDASTMQAGVIDSLDKDGFELGPHGIRSPRSAHIIAADAIAAVLVPGVAFDRDGGRLGRGGGFYDRFLKTVSEDCLTIGVCLAGQLVEAVPREPHDVRVGMVRAASPRG